MYRILKVLVAMQPLILITLYLKKKRKLAITMTYVLIKVSDSGIHRRICH